MTASLRLVAIAGPDPAMSGGSMATLRSQSREVAGKLPAGMDLDTGDMR
jgi:hypothetical protein